MNDNRDYITEAKAKAHDEKRDVDRAIQTDRTHSFFRKRTVSIAGVFEGMFLTALMALVPFLVFAGLAMWSFNATEDGVTMSWVFVLLAVAIPLFVLFRALTSKTDEPAEMLTDLIGGFWVGVFPYLLVGGLVVLAIATWLGVSVLLVLGILCVGGVILAGLTNQ